MKIVFVLPPTAYKETETPLVLPVGVLTLATVLKDHGHQPIIIDLNLFLKSQKVKCGDSFIRQAAQRILSTGANILGFSTLCSNLPISILIARECKRHDPKVKIIFGGPDVTFESRQLLSAFSDLDIVVRGEGEITLLQLLKALKEKRDLKTIEGLTLKQGNKIIETPDRPLIKELDSLPIPELELLPQIAEYEVGAVEAGRGCPYQCVFCSTTQMWGRRFRLKSARRLVKELHYVHRYFKRSNWPILIHLDHLLINRKFVREFLAEISGKQIAWACSSRLDALDEELIGELKKAGCQNIFIGIETASSRLQAIINKNLDLAVLPSLLKALAKHKLSAILSFILGLPQEKEEDLDQTLLCALQCKQYRIPNLVVRLHLLAPLKGSSLFQGIKTSLRHSRPVFNILSPLITNSKAEIALVEEHPDLFPSFYYPKLNTFPYSTMRIIYCLFNFLINYFPITTLLLLSKSSLSPHQLAHKLKEYFNHKGLKEWELPYGLEELYKTYAPYFLDFINNNCPNKIKITAENEQSRFAPDKKA